MPHNSSINKDNPSSAEVSVVNYIREIGLKFDLCLLSVNMNNYPAQYRKIGGPTGRRGRFRAIAQLGSGGGDA
jgi:hypothetical protein